jgi:hypothetical protein
MVEPIVDPFLNTITLWAKYNWRCIFAVENRRSSILTHRQKVSENWVSQVAFVDQY